MDRIGFFLNLNISEEVSSTLPIDVLFNWGFCV